MLDKIDDCIAYIRNIPLEKLRDLTFLESEFLLALGLNNEMIHEFPTELYPYCGRGLKSWQYPNQFSRYLLFLAGQRINRYLEIGCRHGGTFIITVEYLRRFDPLVKSMAIDIEETQIMREYAARHAGKVEYHIVNSKTEQFQALLNSADMWDLVLIDGDHSFEGCLNDFVLVKNKARIVALHDIVNGACPGVQRVWQAIRTTHSERNVLEFVDQYRDVLDRMKQSYLGMGVVRMSA